MEELNIDSIIGVIHLNWDQGEPLYLNRSKTPTCKLRGPAWKGKINAKASRKFQNFLEHQKEILYVYMYY
jgi:hypothetical protein